MNEFEKSNNSQEETEIFENEQQQAVEQTEVLKNTEELPFKTENSAETELDNENEENSEGGKWNIEPENTETAFKPVEYSEIKKEPVGKGVKIFALVMAAIILMTTSCTVGYVIGNNRKLSGGNIFAETTLELEDKPDADDALTTAEVFDTVNKSVVGITVFNSSGEGSVATGVVYTEDGYIITNDHIYAGVVGAKFKVETYDGKFYDAVFVAGDTRSDLAVLKIDATGFYPATFGNSEQVVVGESVVTIGRPSGVKQNSLTRGVVSLKERRAALSSAYSMRVIQTDAPVNPGNSGGALVNMYGQVIGITSAKLIMNSSSDSGRDAYEGIGFAIPSTVTKRIVESLIQYGYVNDRGRLGISYKEINPVEKELNNYAVLGVAVAEVNADSDLYGKVEVGDIITAVNGAEITTDTVILDAIEMTKPNETLEFTVYKTNGSTETVTAKLLPDVGSSSYQSELSAP